MTKEKRLIQADDVYKLVKLEEPRISPDGKWIAYVRVVIDRMENDYKRTIWLSPTGGGEARQITRGSKDMQPRWSPDGETLAFVSVRNDKPQVYLLPLGVMGGEARQLTEARNGANSPEWSPDGKTIAYLAAMSSEERQEEDSDEEQESPQDKLDAKHRKERREEDNRKRQDPMRVWRVPYRTGTSYLDERYAQIYVVPVDETLPEDERKARRLTDVDASHNGLRWSPDGNYLYTSRQIDPTADEPFVNSGVYRVSVADTTSELLTDASYAAAGADPSPDGQWIMFGRQPVRNPGDLEANQRLAVIPAAGGDYRDLTQKLDREPKDGYWMDDNRIVFYVTDRGKTPVYSISPKPDADDAALLANDPHKITAFHTGADGSVAAVVNTPTNPGELAYKAADADSFTTLTSFNADWLDDVTVQETQEMWFKSPVGTDIQGWYILPADYEEGKQYPMVLHIHGGPRVMWSSSEDTMFHEWQLHAANGYVVFYCNPRGSDGYGEQFRRDLHAGWGEVAMADVMAGVDTLAEKGFVDTAHMAVTGGSYGGYMTGWIVGHTDRFAAAVSQRGVYNLVSFYGTTDVPILISSDYGTEPWQDHETLWQHSPLAYAHKVTTPLLIIHSENDFRVPIEQGEQLFAWVRRSGDTPVELVRYPRDGHELSRSGEPEHRVSRLAKQLEWMERYCKPEAAE